MSNTLPDPTGIQPGNIQFSTTSPHAGGQQVPEPTTGGMHKEIEVGIGSLVPEIPQVREIGRDIDLSPEVVNAGVNLVPTTVTLPQPLVQAGIQPAGTSQPIASGVSVILPLSDDQITVGLKESVSTSLRWLAEWCVRRIKQIHTLTKGTHA